MTKTNLLNSRKFSDASLDVGDDLKLVLVSLLLVLDLLERHVDNGHHHVDQDHVHDN